MSITNIWIWLNVLLYLGIGLFTLYSPKFIADAVSFQLMTAGAIAEFKAMYGGLQIALAAIMFILYRIQQINYALAFIGIIYLGFGSGRLLGIILNGALDRTTLIYISVETIGVVLSSYLYLNGKK